MFEYIGKAVELEYETGAHYKVEYLTEDTLRWTSLIERGDRPNSGEEHYYMNKQADGIYTLSWVEKTGISVTQNLDFNALTVYAFMSWPDKNSPGGRGILSHRGTITLLD